MACLPYIPEVYRKDKNFFLEVASLNGKVLEHIPEESLAITYKQFNDDAVNEGITTSNEKRIRTLLYFLIVKGYIRKQQDDTRNVILTRQTDMDATLHRLERRIDICRFSIEWLYALTSTNNNDDKEGAVQFSIIELLNAIKAKNQGLFSNFSEMSLKEVEEAL